MEMDQSITLKDKSGHNGHTNSIQKKGFCKAVTSGRVSSGPWHRSNGCRYLIKD